MRRLFQILRVGPVESQEPLRAEEEAEEGIRETWPKGAGWGQGDGKQDKDSMFCP